MIIVKEISTDGFAIIVDGDSVLKFKELVQRGANLWPDATTEIKEFADQITSGQVMQDYKQQNNEWYAYVYTCRNCFHITVRNFRRGSQASVVACDSCSSNADVTKE